MAVKQYSLAKDGAKQLAPGFRVREFRCRDGSDAILTHEGEAADAKATGDAISAVKARQNILTGTETGNPLSVDDALDAEDKADAEEITQ